MTLPIRLAVAVAAAVLTACASSPPDLSQEDGPAPLGCDALRGRYLDVGRPGSGSTRLRSLGEVLELDPSTFDPVPVGERAIEIRHDRGGTWVLAITKITPPDAIVLWDVPARCEDDEVRFETETRYESATGARIERQQLRFGLIADADGALVVRRQFKRRSVGLFDFRRGGDPVEYFRFEPRELDR